MNYDKRIANIRKLNKIQENFIGALGLKENARTNWGILPYSKTAFKTL